MSATHLRCSENWPKWLVVSAKSCITREPLPLSITDHLGKVSVWPFKECKPPGTLSGQGLLSCIERVPNVATRTSTINGQKRQGNTHGRQHRGYPPLTIKKGWCDLQKSDLNCTNLGRSNHNHGGKHPSPSAPACFCRGAHQYLGDTTPPPIPKDKKNTTRHLLVVYWNQIRYWTIDRNG